jgi:replication-associated recombination protein RarA
MFYKAKELFRDKIDISLYIPLSKKLEIDLMYAISEKEKMILLYGEAGNGKSFLMNKVYDVLKKKNTESELYFIYNPIEEEEILNDLLKLSDNQKHKVIFIDEAQTLSSEKVETIRMCADNNSYTIILATHEKEAKRLFTKKHFSTRINYILNTTPCSYDDMVFFISSKLNQNGFEQIDKMFKKSNYKLIYKFTKGNLREINHLIYRIFDIMNYFYEKDPSKMNKSKIDNKYIEMANIFIKEIHV